MNSRIVIGSVVGVLLLLMALQGVSALQHYNGSCNTTSDCVSEFTCRYGRCKCHHGPPRLFYEESLQMCVSYIGWVCTAPKYFYFKNQLRCTPTATCLQNPMTPDAIFGSCQCNHPLIASDSGKRCVSVVRKIADTTTEDTTVKIEVSTVKAEVTTVKAEVTTVKAEVTTVKAEDTTVRTEETNIKPRVNILTNQGRKSTLTSYKFGDAAYRLNRFFISFPTDGSTLLSVGIVDGERLDESSVKLTGGAVEGQHLTFQTMLIRFGRDWKSQGSEHLLDSKGGQMELQMIFTIAGSVDPIKCWHVLARVQNRLFEFREKLVIILSVLVDALETEEDVIRKIEVEGTLQDPFLFEPFAQAAYHFRKERESNSDQDEPRGYVSMDPVFRFIDFIPKTKSKFYTYRGSLSWPPCFGYVIWSVYQQRLYISKREFDEIIKIPAFGVVDHNRASEYFRREDQITVEEEKRVNIDYATLENLINKRTVHRFILEGVHDYTPEGDDALVDEIQKGSLKRREVELLLRLQLLLSSLLSMGLLENKYF